MPQTLATLLAAIDRAVEASAARKIAREASLASAQTLVSRMPLVHRTAAPDQKKPWREIFAAGLLEADAVRDLERDLGYDRAVYFFAGAGAYPKGNVALLLLPTTLPVDQTTFTPFDTGSMVKGFIFPATMSPATVANWTKEERRRTLEEHLGQGADLAAFAIAYVAAHFRDPREYVTCPRAAQPSRTFQPTTGSRTPGEIGAPGRSRSTSTRT